MPKTRIQTPKETYTFDYPTAIEFAKTQLDVFWTAEEIEVEKDVQDIRVNMSDSESHGVCFVLKLFTQYELIAGNEYWSDRVAKAFPRPDIQRMANAFSFFELNIHAPFYSKLNECLGLDTDEFYNSYKDDPNLVERMEFIDTAVNHKNLLVSLGTFSLVEGVILYSSFAFLKHFQSQGKNLLNNVVAGINFSVRDENMHSEGGAWLFRTLIEEGYRKGEDLEKVNQKIIENAQTIYEHECIIIDKIFELGDIRGITSLQLKHFVQSRINLCLKNLNITPIYEITYNPIQAWFYNGINSIQFHDFFNRTGSEYNRDWSESKFEW